MSKLTDWISAANKEMEFAEEELIVDAAEEIWTAMDTAKVTKKDVAERLGKSKAFVSQLLNGSRNMTLRSLADIAYCVGYRAKVSFAPLHSAAEWRPLNDAIMVQFDLRHLAAPPMPEQVRDEDVEKGSWSAKIGVAA